MSRQGVGDLPEPKPWKIKMVLYPGFLESSMAAPTVVCRAFTCGTSHHAGKKVLLWVSSLTHGVRTRPLVSQALNRRGGHQVPTVPTGEAGALWLSCQHAGTARLSTSASRALVVRWGLSVGPGAAGGGGAHSTHYGEL